MSGYPHVTPNIRMHLTGYSGLRSLPPAGGLDEGPPGTRASYAPDYYGAYVRDLDGNKLHFVRRGEK